MPFEVEAYRTRLVARQTGSFDWQDIDQAHTMCEQALLDRPAITQLLLDLRLARFDLSLSEAGDLARLARLTVSRRLTTALVVAEESPAIDIASQYAAVLNDLGNAAAVFHDMDAARSYLHERKNAGRAGRAGWLRALASLLRPLRAWRMSRQDRSTPRSRPSASR